MGGIVSKSLVLAIVVATTAMSVAPARAFSYETSGKAVAYAMPVVAAGIVAYHRDWKGLAQLTVVTGLTYAAAYSLKQIVKSCRPFAKPCVHGGPDWDSFPSTTSAIASAPSAFVWRRYGWEWGVPLFVVSKYPSYALQKSRQNKLWDGLASTGIAWGINAIFTTHYQKRGFYANVDSDDEGRLLGTVGYRW
jgi:hypothetical protein